ncbi:MAG TPA: cytochrome P450 [Polyangiaceae bacterium]|nr:cytochrome P450 [Polyangiaceae bacterium]
MPVMQQSNVERARVIPRVGHVRAGFAGLELVNLLQRDPVAFFSRLAEQGDLVTCALAGQPFAQVTHPEHIQQVLVEKHRAFRKSQRVRRVLSQWSGDGLALIDGERWVRVRRLVGPAFQSQLGPIHAAIILRRAREMVSRAKVSPSFDASREVSRLTFAVAAEAMFGTEIDTHLDEFIGHVGNLNECAIRELNSLVWLPKWAPTPLKRRVRESAAYLERVVFGFIASARRQRPEHPTLLSVLLDSRDEDGSRLTDRELYDASVNVLLGAHETTAVSLIWSLYCLSEHPEVQAAARAELLCVIGSGEVGPEHLSRLSLIEHVVKEAIRLYPPIYAIPREVAEPVTIGGVALGAGTYVTIVPYITQRDARWFDGPEVFRPARFVRESEIPKGAYLPFGLGPRACIGRSFALLEAVGTLAVLLREFSLHPSDPGSPVELQAQISLHPKGGLSLVLQAPERRS